MCTLESWFTAKPIFVSARSLVDSSPMSRSSCVDVWLVRTQQHNIALSLGIRPMHRISDKNRQRSTVGRVHYLRTINIFHVNKKQRPMCSSCNTTFSCTAEVSAASKISLQRRTREAGKSMMDDGHQIIFWTNYKRTGKRQNLCIFL